MVNRIISLVIIFCLVFEQSGFAQAVPPQQLALPVCLRVAQPAMDKFRPVHLRSITFNDNEKITDVILDKGDMSLMQGREVENAAGVLLEYLEIGLRVPNSCFWVNLRPDAPGKIIDPLLERTDIGRIFLEADVQLKKDLARFTDPSTREGRQYWDRLYSKVEDLFKGGDAVIPTIARPWIVPGEIILNRSKDRVDIYKATVTVMLEEDYIGKQPGLYPGGAGPQMYDMNDARSREINAYSAALMKELIIPKLTREVNSSRRYAAFRQVYYSLIMAQYIKASADRGLPAQLKAVVDSKDISGLGSKSPWSKDTYFDMYSKSIAEGEYRKEETLSNGDGYVVRQYVSGGISFTARDGGSFTVFNNLPRYDFNVNAVPLSVSANRDGGKTIKLYHAKTEGRSIGGFYTDDPNGRIISVGIFDETENINKGKGLLGRIRAKLSISRTPYSEIYVDDIVRKDNKLFKILSITNAAPQAGSDAVNLEVKLVQLGLDGAQTGNVEAVEAWKIFDEYQLSKPGERIVSGYEGGDVKTSETETETAAETAVTLGNDEQVQPEEAPRDVVTKAASDTEAEKDTVEPTDDVPESTGDVSKPADDSSKPKDAGISIWGAVMKNSRRALLSSAITSIIFGAASASVAGFGAALLATIPVFLAAALVPILAVQYYHQKGVVKSEDVALYTAEAMLVGVLLLSVVTAMGGFNAISLGGTWHQTAEHFLNNGGQLSSLAGYVQTGAIGLGGVNFLGWNLSRLSETPKVRIVLAGIGIGIGIGGIVAGISLGLPLLVVPGITLIIQSATLLNALFAGKSRIEVVDDHQTKKDADPNQTAGKAGTIEGDEKTVKTGLLDDSNQPKKNTDGKDVVDETTVVTDSLPDSGEQNSNLGDVYSIDGDEIIEPAGSLEVVDAEDVKKIKVDDPDKLIGMLWVDENQRVWRILSFDPDRSDVKLELFGSLNDSIEWDFYAGTLAVRTNKTTEKTDNPGSVLGAVYSKDGEIIEPAGSLEIIDPEKEEAMTDEELDGMFWVDDVTQVVYLMKWEPDVQQFDLSLYGYLRKEGEVFSEQDSNTLVLNDMYEAGTFAVKKDGGRKYGGIDMRALPVTTAAVLASRSALPDTVNVKELAQLAARSDITDLRAEWSAIDRAVREGKNIPYERLKEFYAVCSARQGGDVFKKLVVDYVQAVLRAEEDLAAATDPGMKAFMQYL